MASPSSGLDRLPAELLLQIAQYSSFRTLRCMSLVSRRVRRALLPHLFGAITITFTLGDIQMALSEIRPDTLATLEEVKLTIEDPDWYCFIDQEEEDVNQESIDACFSLLQACHALRRIVIDVPAHTLCEKEHAGDLDASLNVSMVWVRLATMLSQRVLSGNDRQRPIKLQYDLSDQCRTYLRHIEHYLSFATLRKVLSSWFPHASDTTVSLRRFKFDEGGPAPEAVDLVDSSVSVELDGCRGLSAVLPRLTRNLTAIRLNEDTAVLDFASMLQTRSQSFINLANITLDSLQFCSIMWLASLQNLPSLKSFAIIECSSDLLDEEFDEAYDEAHDAALNQTHLLVDQILGVVQNNRSIRNVSLDMWSRLKHIQSCEVDLKTLSNCLSDRAGKLDCTLTISEYFFPESYEIITPSSILPLSPGLRATISTIRLEEIKVNTALRPIPVTLERLTHLEVGPWSSWQTHLSWLLSSIIVPALKSVNIDHSYKTGSISPVLPLLSLTPPSCQWTIEEECSRNKFVSDYDLKRTRDLLQKYTQDTGIDLIWKALLARLTSRCKP